MHRKYADRIREDPELSTLVKEAARRIAGRT